MDLNLTIYVLAAVTIVGAVLAPLLGVLLTIMRAGPPPDVEREGDADE